VIQLLAFYFRQAAFPIIHLFMLVVGIWLTSRSFKRSRVESLVLDAIRDGHKPDEYAGLLAAEYFGAAESRAEEGASVDAETIADMYREDRFQELEWLDRLATLFLLTGVVGTLWGLFSTVSGSGELAKSAADANVRLILVEAFKAFGVTMVAVFLSAIIHLMDMAARRRITLVATKLRIGLSEVRAVSNLNDSVTDLLENVSDVLGDLSESIDGLKGTLANPAAFTESLKAVNGNLEVIRSSLTDTAESLKNVFGTVDLLRRQAEQSYQDSATAIAGSLKQLEVGVNAAFREVSGDLIKVSQMTGKMPLEIASALEKNNQAFLSNLNRYESVSHSFFNEQTALIERICTKLSSNAVHLSDVATTLEPKVAQIDVNLKHLDQSIGTTIGTVQGALKGFEDGVTGSLKTTNVAFEQIGGEFKQFAGTIAKARMSISGVADRPALAYGGPGRVSVSEDDSFRSTAKRRSALGIFGDARFLAAILVVILFIVGGVGWVSYRRALNPDVEGRSDSAVSSVDSAIPQKTAGSGQGRDGNGNPSSHLSVPQPSLEKVREPTVDPQDYGAASRGPDEFTGQTGLMKTTSAPRDGTQERASAAEAGAEVEVASPGVVGTVKE